MIAEILCVGTELLLGNITNTNAAYLSRELADLGIFTYYQSVVGDNPERLKKALAISLERSDIVIMTGGLGPTYDDLTKETVAEMFGLDMEMHDHSRGRIAAFFANLGREITKNNEKQAMMPAGAVVFDNDYGTAPALSVEKDNKTCILLPGPPREMEPIFQDKIKPYLLGKSQAVLRSKTVHIFGMGESAVEAELVDLMKDAVNPTIAPYAKEGEVELRVTSLGKDAAECDEKINGSIEQIKKRIGEKIYGIDVASLQNALILKLRECGLTLATAESCTGGLIGGRITSVSGSSDVYLGGAVTYSNELKMKMLGVKKETLDKFGAVSRETAAEMAEGIRRESGADIAVSVTGIAGPGGGTETKPVGLVYIGVCIRKKFSPESSSENGEQETSVKEYKFNHQYKNGRDFIRHVAASNAIFDCIEAVKKYFTFD